MLTTAGCRARQDRLLREMAALKWDLFVTANYRTAYYLTGSLGPAEAPTAFLLWGDGSSALLTSIEAGGLADRIVQAPLYSIDRCITQPFHDAAALLRPLMTSRPFRTCGVERARMPGMWEELLGAAPIADAGSTILRIRKRKEPDEIDEIRESLRYCKVAYAKAKEVIAPGLTEIDVYGEMYSAVTRAAGRPIPFPGDFACGDRAIRGGGPPTSRKLQSHDLYILDLFPEQHLYFGDVCRTFAVGPPTDAQARAFQVVRDAIKVGEAAIKPGVAARTVYAAVKEFLDNHDAERSFWHHAGHGIGFHGHEAPRIIPGSDDVFEVGDVFTLEPGIYSKALQGGVRLEDNYVLSESGLENLFDFPMEL